MVSDTSRPKPSATLAIIERISALRSAGREIFQMGFGQSPFPVPEPLVQALREYAHEKAYLPVAGLPELRRAIAASTARDQGIEVSAGQVIIGPGTKELMFILQLVCDAEVLIPAPAWVSYAPQAELCGREVTWLPAARDSDMRLTAAQLDSACRRDSVKQRILILNYPCNPTGVSYRAEQLEAIAEVAHAHGILILADEIYGGLHFRGEHVSIARFYPQGTIISNGISKWAGAGGWRLGAFVLPRERNELRDAMIAVASETFSSVAAPIQYAAIPAFEAGAVMTSCLRESRRILGALLTHAARRLREAGAQTCEPEGGFYLFPDFSATRAAVSRSAGTAAAFCELALEETGVAMLPGNEFGWPPNIPAARLALVDFDGAGALAAAGDTLDEDFLAHHCQPVMRGIDRLCDWLARG